METIPMHHSLPGSVGHPQDQSTEGIHIHGGAFKCFFNSDDPNQPAQSNIACFPGVDHRMRIEG